jgi:hypothetical protein
MAASIRPLNMRSEPVSRTGGIIGDGLLNLIGSPGFNLLTVALREAVQNSWDARRRQNDGSCPEGVRFGVEAVQLAKKQLEALRGEVFTNASRLPQVHPLVEQLSTHGLVIMTMYDRGTVGLDGPMAPGRAPEGGRKANFVDFIFQFGRRKRADTAGGTYGFGKIAFYQLSRARAIIVHTRCEHRGRLQHRLMACSISGGDGEEAGETGRRWWGHLHGQRIGPALGRDASSLARRIGMPRFDGDETGTSVAIIAPDLGDFDDSPRDAVRFLAAETARWFWPRMVRSRKGDGPIRFETRWMDEVIPVPSLDQQPYVTYVRCLAAIDERLDGTPPSPSSDVRCQEVMGKRPVTLLGHLGLGRFLHDPSGTPVTPVPDDEIPVSESAGHHVALMRGPRIVVRYLEGTPLPGGFVKYAGAFLSAEEHEETFARAEPPTHDNWVADASKLDRAQRRTINVTFTRLWEALEEYVRPAQGGQSSDATPLGRIADFLGGALLAGAASGDGARTQRERAARLGGGHHVARRSSTARIVGHGTLTRNGEQTFLDLDVEVDLAPDAIAQRLGLRVAVLLDGSASEATPPSGAGRPEVIAWTNPAGVVTRAAEVVLTAGDGGKWSARISLPRLSKVRLGAELAEEGGASQ